MKPKLSKELKEYMSKLGCSGGKARRDALTPAQRRNIAKRAARTRWAKAKKEKKS